MGALGYTKYLNLKSIALNHNLITGILSSRNLDVRQYRKLREYGICGSGRGWDGVGWRVTRIPSTSNMCMKHRLVRYIYQCAT